jgi:hypothetical protein
VFRSYSLPRKNKDAYTPWKLEPLWRRRAGIEEQCLAEPFGLRLVRGAKRGTSGCSRSQNAYLSTPLLAVQAVSTDRIQGFVMIGNGTFSQCLQPVKNLAAGQHTDHDWMVYDL